MANQTSSMTEQEFFNELEDSLVVLVTSSPDKRSQYRTLFSTHDSPHHEGGQGVNFHFTDSGALGIAPRKTPEKESDYSAHVQEKSSASLDLLRSQNTSIRNKLRQGTLDNPNDIPLVVMTEDSGWELTFDHLTGTSDEIEQQKSIFFADIERQLQDKFRDCDKEWLCQKIDTSFPGANIKPFMEHLEGGLVELMDIIYNAAETAGIEELHSENTYRYSFAFDENNKVFEKEFKNQNIIVSREDFAKLTEHPANGKAVSLDMIQIPYQQELNEDGVPASRVYSEIKPSILSQSSTDFPSSSGIRDVTEWLQAGIGTRQSTQKEQQQDIHIAYISPATLQGEELPSPDFIQTLQEDNYTLTYVPSLKELSRFPDINMLNGSDMLVLASDPIETTPEGLIWDPNLPMLTYMMINVDIDPASMTTPIILDNRTGGFDHTLDMMRQSSKSGRLIGEFSFMVAETTEELESLLHEQRTVLEQRAVPGSSAQVNPLPDDDIMNVFVAGGHNNNSRQDLEEAHQLGYFLAEQGIRIVSGGGQVEGSMGATHTGFIQYHLDQLMEHGDMFAGLPKSLQKELRQHLYYDTDKQCMGYNAEALITDHSDVLDKLTERHIIPADMFHSYSTEALIEMESPNGRPPAGSTYQSAGNRIPRLDALLGAHTKLFMPGGIGTDEEIFGAISLQMEALGNVAANDNGETEKPELDKLIIYNRNHQIDTFLQGMGLMHEDGRMNQQALGKYNIEILGDTPSIEASLTDRLNTKDSWQDRIRSQREKIEPSLNLAS